MALTVTLNGSTHEVDIVRRRPHLVLRIDGREHSIAHLPEEGDGRRMLGIDASRIAFVRAAVGDRQIVRFDGRTSEVGIIDRAAVADDEGVGQDAMRAPMPGAVVALHCRVGAQVKRGEKVVTIESMKLQTALPAPRDGTIAAIPRAEGQTFEKDDVLVMLVPLAEED